MISVFRPGRSARELKNFLFRLHVDRGKRVVQHQNRGLFGQRACDRQPLLLATRKIHAALSEPRLVGACQPEHVLMNRRQLRRLFDRSDTAGFDFPFVHSVRDVLDDALAEKKNVLAHVSHALAKLLDAASR